MSEVNHLNVMLSNQLETQSLNSHHQWLLQLSIDDPIEVCLIPYQQQHTWTHIYQM